MSYPAFFDEAPTLTLRDPLADFLGAAENGIVTYTYLDAVKLAGHSCPTVAGAFLMTITALEALYPGELPVRGEIAVELGDRQEEGVAGVVASIAGLLTGAAGIGGFAGIGGRFVRRDMLRFGSGAFGEVTFRRGDRTDGITASVDLWAIPADPEIPALMRRVLGGTATASETRDFRWGWQNRVHRILTQGRACGIVSIREGRRAA